MTCNCGKTDKSCPKKFPSAVVEINNPESLVLLRKVVIPASMGDETAFPPAIGKYFNVLLHYEASGSNYLYSSDGIPTEIGANVPQELLDRIEALEDGYDDLAEDYEQLQSQVGDVSAALSAETSARENADIGLQGQIDAITSSSDVKDIVGTYTELQNYDTSTLGNDDIIKVLQDSTHNNAMTYYRWIVSGGAGSWQYIGEEGPYYTKSETETLLNNKQDEITSSNKLLSDLVDDANQTNKFVTTSEKQTWDNKASGIINTQSGDVVQIKDGANNKEVISLDVDINANQNLHGYEYPWAGGEGKNLLDPSKVSAITAYGLTITFSNNVFSISGTPTTQSASLSFNFVEYSDYSLSGKNYVIQALENSGTPIKGIYGFRTEQEKRVAIVFDSVANPTINTTFKLSVSTTSQTVWSPYENICPITGWTGATISQSGEDTSDPTTRNISWENEAGTIYGGNLNVTTGLLTVTDQFISSYNGETLPSSWISDRDKYEAGQTPTTGAQVVYKIITPVTYHLTAQAINTLLGINNIWANTGDTTVKYRADTKLYIDTKFDILSNQITSLDDRVTLLEG